MPVPRGRLHWACISGYLDSSNALATAGSTSAAASMIAPIALRIDMTLLPSITFIGEAPAQLLAGTAIALFPDVFHHPLGADLGAEDIAPGVSGDAFGGARGGGVLLRVGNECGHGAVLGAADPHAAFPFGVVL